MPRVRSVLAAPALALAVACSSDSNGVVVDFPALDAAALAAFCHRSNASPPATINGTLAVSDCDAGDSYYEVYRVRVAAARSVTFSVSSGFDNYIEVVQLVSIVGTTVTVNLLDEDDDSGPGTNATVTVTLDPGEDYFVAVSGFDYSEVGAYTLSIQ